MLNSAQAVLRPLKDQDLIIILEWRNNEDIRKWMINTSIIKYEDHLNWFKKNQLNSNNHYLILEYEAELIGYMSLQKIHKSSVYEWGFYIKPNAPQGSGLLLGQLSLKYAFEQLKANKVFGQVLSFNVKSLNFHKKMRFTQEGILRNHFIDERGTFDIYQFGLLKTEWLESSI